MSVILHASCVAWGESGLLILGPSGSGKSALALQMMALGCDLVADDRTEVDGPFARAPQALQGLVEARLVGLLRAPFRPEARLTLAVDLGQTETDRLPPARHIDVQGQRLPLVLGPLRDHLGPALLCHLKGSRFA